MNAGMARAALLRACYSWCRQSPAGAKAPAPATIAAAATWPDFSDGLTLGLTQLMTTLGLAQQMATFGLTQQMTTLGLYQTLNASDMLQSNAFQNACDTCLGF